MLFQWVRPVARRWSGASQCARGRLWQRLGDEANNQIASNSQGRTTPVDKLDLAIGPLQFYRNRLQQTHRFFIGLLQNPRGNPREAVYENIKFGSRLSPRGFGTACRRE